MLPIKACVFDLDGTLCDTIEDLADAVNRSLKLNGFDAKPVSAYFSYLGNGSSVLIHKAIGREVSEAVFSKVFIDYLDFYNTHFAIKTRPFKGTEEALAGLKSRGIKLACLTNKPDGVAKDMISSLFPGLFDEVIGNRKDLPTKPDPTGLCLLLKDLGVTPEETAYFGDSDVDMILCDRAGIKRKAAVAYGYRMLKELMDQNPYKIIYRPCEIGEIS